MQSPTFKLRNTIVRAGAGAGKTTALTSYVVDLALNFKKQYNVWPKIVVTTFTRKATQELKERISLKAFKEDNFELVQFVNSKSRLHISTIHGVLHIFLSRYGNQIGLNPGFKFIESHQNDLLRKRILKSLISVDNRYVELLDSYSFAQLSKLLNEYFHFKYQNENIRTLNINDHLKSFCELTSRHTSDLIKICNLVISESSDAKFSEYFVEYQNTLENVNKLIAQAVKSEYRFKEQEQSQTSSEANAKQGDDDLRIKALSYLSDFKVKFSRKPSLKKANPAISEELDKLFVDTKKAYEIFLESEECSVEFWHTHSQVNKNLGNLLSAASDEYLSQKFESGLIDMQDLETLSCLLIAKSPESARLFSHEWDFWLLDEYQDTSPLQVKLFNSLIGDRSTYVVGDPQQSIYLFRGANYQVFNQLERNYKNSSHNVVLKMENYRSSRPLLCFINSYFTKLSDQFRSMTPQKEASRLFGKDISKFYLCKAPTTKKKNNNIIQSDQIAQIESAKTVTNLIDEDMLKEDIFESSITNQDLQVVEICQNLLKSGVPPEEICILGRTNLILNKIADVLIQYDIAIQLHSSGSFWVRQEIKDALVLLKFLANPHDNKNLIDLLRAPFAHLNDQLILESIVGESKSYWRNILTSKHNTNVVVQDLQQILNFSYQSGISEAFEKALIHFKYFDTCSLYDSTGRRESNLWKLISLLKDKEKTTRFNIIGFINGISKKLSTEEGDDGDAAPVIEPKRINLMTVHASKGLQFSHVIIPYFSSKPQVAKKQMFSTTEFEETLAENIFSVAIPYGEEGITTYSLFHEQIRQKRIEQEQLESERVLYVAFTRAKETISIVSEMSPADNSWLAECPMSLALGKHEELEFNYEVIEADPKPERPKALNVQDQVAVPDFYKKNHEEKAINAISVTELIEENYKNGVKNFEFNSISAEEKSNRIKHALRGEEVHAMLEALKYHDFEWIKTEYIHFKSNPNELLDVLSYFKQRLELLDIIKNGFVEWGFVVNTKRGLLQGQIDLWFVDVNNAVWIIDYKTGSSKYSEKAIFQLKVYLTALWKMNKVSLDQKVNLLVIYPFEGKEVEIKEDLVSSQILKDL